MQNNDANDEGAEKSEGSPHHSRTRTLSENSQSEGNTTPNNDKRQCIEIPSVGQHKGFQFPGVPASPPKFISVEQIIQAADVFSNMALAHEIAVNKDFVLEKALPESNLQEQVKEVVHKAFWDAFQTQLLEDPPNYSQALVLLAEIKEMILGLLLPYQARIKKQIDEVLDLDLIKQQVDNDALDFQYYAQFIISLMLRFCAPVRDEKIQELTKIKDIVPLYKGIFETLDLLKLDMANFTLQQMRPHIQQHSVEYERKKFQEFLTALKNLATSVDGLELTKKWLQDVYTLTASTAQPSSSTGSSEIPNSLLITKAYLNVFDWTSDYIFPETLQMDQGRFLSLKDQFINIVLAASALLITYSIVGPAIQGLTKLKSELKDQLFILLKGVSARSPEEIKSKLDSIALQVVQEVNKSLEEHGFDLLTEEKSKLIITQINEIHSKDHSVKKLINTRILEFIEQVLQTPNVASVKFPIGLSAFHKELSSLAGQFLQLIKHNQATFCNIYDEILDDYKKNFVSTVNAE